MTENTSISGGNYPTTNAGPEADEAPKSLLPTGIDVWFSGTLRAQGEALRRLVNNFIKGALFHEDKTARRKRKRRPQDQKAFESLMEIVICNLVSMAVNPTRSGMISISLRKGEKQSRYGQQTSPKVLRGVIQTLEEVDALKLYLGRRGQFQSRIEPTKWFISQVRQSGVTQANLRPGIGPEVILLTRTTKHSNGPGKDKHKIEYEDTEETTKLRAQVREVNAFLETAEIGFLADQETSDLQAVERIPPASEVRVSDTTLRRHFKLLERQEPRFDQYGRLYGGWWITLQKERRPYIRLQGEPIAYLDFASMNVRLAYAYVGQGAPEGDMYDLTGHWPGFSLYRHREAIKTTMSAMWFKGELERFPMGGKKGLPKNLRMETIVGAIKSKHPLIAPILGQTLGYTFAFMESNVLLAVLERVNARGIAALPLHDALMVPEI